MKICIDPGHGGSDPGAVGPAQTKEKEHTLAVAMYLRGLLQQAGHLVVLTRESDTDVAMPGVTDGEELQARVDVANSAGANLFISIHCNAAANPAAHGTETYHADGSPGGSMFAQYVHSELVPLGLTNRGTKTANFYVLRYTKAPAILVELAFITNPEEEQLLDSDEWRQKFAEAIYRGIKHYIGGV